jgi:hypothetical protein
MQPESMPWYWYYYSQGCGIVLLIIEEHAPDYCLIQPAQTGNFKIEPASSFKKMQLP